MSQYPWCSRHGNPEEVAQILVKMEEAEKAGRVLPLSEEWPHGIFPDGFSYETKRGLPCTCNPPAELPEIDYAAEFAKGNSYECC